MSRGRMNNGRARIISTFAAAAVVAGLLFWGGCTDDDDDDIEPRKPIIDTRPGSVPAEEPALVWTGAVTLIEKERWGLVEYRKVSDCTEEIANANSGAIQDALDHFTAAGQFRLRLEKGTYCLWGVSYERFKDEDGKPVYGNVVKIPSNVEFDLGESTLKLAPHVRTYTSILQILLAENVKVFNGTLIGDRLTHDYNSENSDHYGGGVWVWSSQNVILSDLVISEVTGDCITVGDRDPISKNVLIDNITCSRARRDGIVATNVNGLIIRNSHIFDIYNAERREIDVGAEACIAFEATGHQEVSNVEIYNNVLNGISGIDIKPAYARQFLNIHSGAQNIVVRDNEMHGRLEWRFGKNILFKDNKIYDGSFAMGGPVNNTTSPTGFGANFIIENNEFYRYHIDGTQANLGGNMQDYKENLAFIGNTFYNPAPNVGPLLIVNARTNTALIDNVFKTDYTNYYCAIRIAIDVPPTRGMEHIYYYVNNKMPKAATKDDVGFSWPRMYGFPLVPGDTWFSLNEDDVLDKSNHTAKVPLSAWEWFNESADRDAALAWVDSWRWYGSGSGYVPDDGKKPNDNANNVPVEIAADGTFTDKRDGKIYRTVKIGGLVWMAENLNYKTRDGAGSWCYVSPDNVADVDCAKYGRYYDWATAMDIDEQYLTAYWRGSDENHRGVCPAGWRIPNNKDWNDLVEAIGGRNDGGAKLKSTEPNIWHGNATDEFGFAALAGAHRNNNGWYYYEKFFARFWSAAEYDRKTSYYEFLTYQNDKVERLWDMEKINGLPVRCVADAFD